MWFRNNCSFNPLNLSHTSIQILILNFLYIYFLWLKVLQWTALCAYRYILPIQLIFRYNLKTYKYCCLIKPCKCNYITIPTTHKNKEESKKQPIYPLAQDVHLSGWIQIWIKVCLTPYLRKKNKKERRGKNINS